MKPLKTIFPNFGFFIPSTNSKKDKKRRKICEEISKEMKPSFFKIQAMFPKASQSFIKANPGALYAPGAILPPERVSRSPGGRMNRTEAEFALRLEAMKRAGEILRWEFQGITLRWFDMRYTPDFIVFWDRNAGFGDKIDAKLKLIEVKGPFCKGKYERAVEHFKHARTYYGDVFCFELHQKTKDGWKQIY